MVAIKNAIIVYIYVGVRQAKSISSVYSYESEIVEHVFVWNNDRLSFMLLL